MCPVRTPSVSADTDEFPPLPPLADDNPDIDPVEATIDAVVQRLLASHDDAFAHTLTAPGAVIVLRAPEAWCEDYRAHFLTAAYRAVPGASDRQVGHVFQTACTEAPYRPEIDPGWVREAVHRITDGDGALGVTPDLAWLPAVLVRAADLTIDIPAFDGELIREIAEKVGTGRAKAPDDAVAAEVTPLTLALAARPGQTAQGFVDLVSRQIVLARPEPEPPKARGEIVWTLDNLPLPADVEGWARQLIADLDAYKRGEIPWADVDKGALLYGPPGCGKTTFAKALANSSGMKLFVGSYAIWESGEDASGRYDRIIGRMRQMFIDARKAAPSVVFIDELDSIMGRGQGGHNESWFRPLNNALLAELDGIAGREGVVVIGATNYPENVDEALRRSGRLDRELELALPDLSQLARILAVHLPDLSAEDAHRAAVAGYGASGADCARWARDARRRAGRGKPVSVEHVLGAIRAGTKELPPRLKHRVAVHEAGHAVAACNLAFRTPDLVTIRPAVREHGGVLAAVEEPETRADVEAFLIVLLAGRAAEEIEYGEAGPGAGGTVESDLAKATSLAAMIELSFGLGATLSWAGSADPKEIATLLAWRRDAAERVEKRLQQALRDALDLLEAHRHELDAVAVALETQETLCAKDVAGIMHQARRQRGREAA